MLSRLYQLCRDYIMGSEPPPPPFKPHPGWLRLNQLHQTVTPVKTASPALIQPPAAIPEENLGVMPMDISDGEVEDMFNIDNAAQQEVKSTAVSDDDSDQELPPRYVDCVTLEPMHSPVVSRNGRTYERATLIALAKKNPGSATIPCPEGGLPIEVEAIKYVSNYVIKEEIAERLKNINERKRQHDENNTQTQATVDVPKRQRFFQPVQEMVTQPASCDNILAP